MLLLGNMFYQEPEHGDIVVISKKSFDDGKPIVKRVIAVEGQTVDIDFENAVVYVDGVALEEPYINSPTSFNEGNTFPLTVAENCIFVLGDNRNNSMDSRFSSIGMIDERCVLGKVLFIVLPGQVVDDYGKVIVPRDWGRIGLVS